MYICIMMREYIKEATTGYNTHVHRAALGMSMHVQGKACVSVIPFRYSLRLRPCETTLRVEVPYPLEAHSTTINTIKVVLHYILVALLPTFPTVQFFIDQTVDSGRSWEHD